MFFGSTFFISIFLSGAMVPTLMLMHTGWHRTPMGLVVELPQPIARSACQPGIPPPLISVRGRPPQVFYDGVLVGPEGLREHLLHSLAFGPVPMVYVDGEREQQVHDVYDVIDQLNQIDRQLVVALLTPGMRRDACLVVRVHQ
jgi:hypothetical protein